MPDDTPVIRVAQIWASRAESDRRFFVFRTRDGFVHGMDYYAHKSSTRDKTLGVHAFVDQFTLLEDTPAHLLRGAVHA
ncbi:MAG: hypothetical protein JWO11_2675 [Nocardioides sp.]|nr:hypothetical protein [Nocardioides sp.]